MTTPKEHYELAEAFAKRAATTNASAPDAGLKFAVLAVAHALMSSKREPSTPSTG